MIVLGLRRLNLKARFFLLSFSFHTCRRVTFTTSFLRRHTQVHFSVTIDVRPVLFLGGSLAAASEIIGNMNFFVFPTTAGTYYKVSAFGNRDLTKKKISCMQKLIPQTTHLEDHRVFTQSISRVLFSRAQQATSFKSFTVQIELSSI